jgi:hypothetical protein
MLPGVTKTAEAREGLTTYMGENAVSPRNSPAAR